ncbi:hypothetical protein D3C76_1320030 [compost metagenome]
MSGDIQIIPNAQHPHLGLMLQAQSGAATEHDQPLPLSLVVPESRRAGLATGNDAFDAQARTGQQRVELLGGMHVRQGQGSKQIVWHGWLALS